MMNDLYSEMTPQDHDDLGEWLDEQGIETQRLLNQVCKGVEAPEEDLQANKFAS